MLVQKKTCRICLNDDIKAEQMFYVVFCDHWFCMQCMKRHIETKLLEGTVPRCPNYQCESTLTLRSCVHLLTPERKAMWQQKIEEESLPVKERVYCPKPRCSALMSITELFKSTEKGCESRRCCLKCGEHFCINCKVPWHSNLSCNDYKRLGPNSTTDDMLLKVLADKRMWRQCKKCQHMIERSEGCHHVTCRCGYEFCYICGAPWTIGPSCIHLPSHPVWIFGFLIFVIIVFLGAVLTNH